MSTLVQDLRYGVRSVLAQPGFSLVVILTLALAIGANTVTFSFTNILLLRPLPVHDQDTLGWIFMVDPQRGGDRGLVSIPDLLDYRSSLQSFENIAATSTGSVTMSGRGDAVALRASRVTANVMDTWGLQMLKGRTFAAGEDKPGAAPVAVVSHQFWQRQFGGDSSIVGQHLTLDGQPVLVVGVLKPEIEIGNLSLIDVWLPVNLDPTLPRDARTLRVSARLRPGTTFEQAAAEVRTVAQRLEREHPRSNAGWSARLAPTREAMTGSETWVILSLLMVVVGFVLLIACANIANLVLARATGRRREMAVRAALGAGRARMVRQLLTESLLLGVCGGIVGLGVAYAGLAVIKAAAYEPFFELVKIDGNVLAFTALLSLASPIVFSLLPALQMSKTDLNDALKDSGTRTGGGVKGRRSRAALVVSQLSLATALLIVATLLVRTMIAINNAPLGFNTEGLATLRVDAPQWRYGTDAAVTDFYDRLLARLAALPGVASVAATDRLPVLGGESTTQVDVDGQPPAREQDRPWAVRSNATEQVFATTGIPILAGRSFEPRDSTDTQPVAVVNAEMARRYWGEPARALGARLRIEGDSRGWMQIVGVVGNVVQPDLRSPNPHVYLPARQRPHRALAILVKADTPEALLPAIRTEVRALDANVAVEGLRTVEEAFDDELSSSRILAGMFISFAVIALTLAAAGLYGVISYSVSQRVQEIGIRMALGAVPADIRRLVVRQTAVLIVTGAAIGLAGGAAIARATSTLLYDVSPSDPSTYLIVAGLLALVAAASALTPLRRATRIDPLIALRAE